MLKSDFGTVEVTGFKPVVMAELETLLKVLKSELGEEVYNRVLQDVNDLKQVEDELKEKEAKFGPHLVSDDYWCTDYGRIGEETNIYDIVGEKLSVGDTVNLYSIIRGQLEFCGEHSIVKQDDSEFVMSVHGCKFEHGESDDGRVTWFIIMKRQHTGIENGETVNGIKYIKSERTGK